MNIGYLKLLKAVEKNKENQLTIPELDIKITNRSKAMVALFLLPLTEDIYNQERVVIERKAFNRKIVENAYNHIKYLKENMIEFLILIGSKAEEALKLFEKKYGHLIIKDDHYKIIKKNGEIFIPIQTDTINNNVLETLSKIGVTIIQSDNFALLLYHNGKNPHIEFIDSPGFIEFTYTFGFYVDEYLFGYLLYELSLEDNKLKDALLNNLDSQFVISLADILGSGSFKVIARVRRSTGYDPDDIADLINILKNIGMDKIKDLDFNFVRMFLYEQSQ